MKKQLIKPFSTRVFALFFAGFILFSGSQSVFAADDSTKNKGAEITYQGLRDKKLVFNVNYKNEISQPFQLTIKNDQHQIIYVKHFDAKPLNTTMLFSEFPENGKLTFSIISGKKEISQAFEINSEVRTVEELIVKGL